MNTNSNQHYSLAESQNPEPEHKYSQATNITCDKSSCPFPNRCTIDQKVCICAPEYAELNLYKNELNLAIQTQNSLSMSNIRPNSTNSTILNNALNQTESKSNPITTVSFIQKSQVLADDLNTKTSTNTDAIIPNSIDTAQQKVVYCVYKRVNQMNYFLLEFFLNSGIGHLLAKHYIIGGVKMGLVLLPWVLFWIINIFTSASSECVKDPSGRGTWTMFIFLFISFSWWVVDAILIGMKILPDGNGVPLLYW